MWSTENKSGVTPRLFIANQKLPLEMGLEKTEVTAVFTCGTAFLAFHGNLWALLYNLASYSLLSYLNHLESYGHPGKMYLPQGVYTWDYLPVLRKGRAAWHCADHEEPCSAFPPLDKRHFFYRSGGRCGKEGYARCRGMSYAVCASLECFGVIFGLNSPSS